MSETSSTTPCGLGIRGVSIAIDSVVWVVLLFVSVVGVGAITGQLETAATGVSANLEGPRATLALGLWLTLAIGYHTGFEWLFGKTLGKYLVGIEVRNADGTSPPIGAAFLRNVLRPVDFLPVLYGLGMIVIAFSDRNKRLGDRLGGTVVVRG